MGDFQIHPSGILSIWNFKMGDFQIHPTDILSIASKNPLKSMPQDLSNKSTLVHVTGGLLQSGK